MEPRKVYDQTFISRNISYNLIQDDIFLQNYAGYFLHV